MSRAAQLAGDDPDYSLRDLFESIANWKYVRVSHESHVTIVYITIESCNCIVYIHNTMQLLCSSHGCHVTIAMETSYNRITNEHAIFLSLSLSISSHLGHSTSK